MSPTLSRRSFLKGSLAAAAALAAGSVPAAAAISDGSGHLATLLDISKCIACGACVEACRETNQPKFPEPRKPFPKLIPPKAKNVDWSDKRDVDDRLTPYNWLYVETAYVEHDGEEHEVNVPRRCMHCTNPPCVKLCPFGAAEQLNNGIARIDDSLCMGGAKCKKVCPWKIPERQSGVGLYLDLLPNMAGNGVMYKCDRCHDRLEKGELPACIEACPEDVQTIGPRKEIIRQAHARAEDMGGYLYGEKENGGTNTIYVSPVPFNKLNRAIEKGRGKPHLKPVEDQMADGNKLAAALAIAPIAGIAAAIGRFYKTTK